MEELKKEYIELSKELGIEHQNFSIAPNKKVTAKGVLEDVVQLLRDIKNNNNNITEVYSTVGKELEVYPKEDDPVFEDVVEDICPHCNAKKIDTTCSTHVWHTTYECDYSEVGALSSKSERGDEYTACKNKEV